MPATTVRESRCCRPSPGSLGAYRAGKGTRIKILYGIERPTVRGHG
jgi:hypothetical protein